MSTITHARHGQGHLLRHVLEMTVVMMVGMMVLGGLFRGAIAAVGVDYADARLRLPGLFALVMAVNMSVPMAWWMRRRGHGWGYAAEMVASMIVPVLALLPPLWLGMISGDTLSSIQHVIMLPSMIVVMLRRRGELPATGSVRARP